MVKKGQAAMEFLMTYGWAILAAIVVIGILGYYYFNKNILSPSSGVVSAPFYLNAWTVNTTGVYLELKNNGGETYNITSINVDNCGTLNHQGNAGLLNQGALNTYAVTCSLTQGNLFSGDITVKYKKEGGTLEMTSMGSLKEKVA